MVPTCPQPRDEAKIAKNRDAFMKANPRSQRGPRRKLESDGTPLIRNKHGAYVLDQQRIHQAQEALAESEPDPSDSTPSTETTTASVNVARKAQSKASLDRVRAFLVKR